MSWGAVLQDLQLPAMMRRWCSASSISPTIPRIRPIWARSPGATPTASPAAASPSTAALPGRHRTSWASTLLHGGAKGFGKRVWDVALHGADFVTLTLHSPDGDMGFPGAIDVTCTYRLKIPGTLSIELTATTDEPTLCNLAHHSYFNLEDGGSGDVLDHRLMLTAAAYLPVDDELIPTGVVQPVDGTPSISGRRARSATRRERRADPVRPQFLSRRASRRAEAGGLGARRRPPASRWKSGPPSPACSSMPATRWRASRKGLGGRRYKACAGFCLEPQVWPDSPNRPYFPQAVLWPGEIYRQTTEYRFRQG